MRADDVQRAADRPYSVAQPEEAAGFGLGTCPADPVVPDLDDAPVSCDLQPYPGAGSLRVLDDVRQRFGAEEVEAGLDGGRQPDAGNVDLDGNGDPVGQATNGRCQAMLGEDRGMQAGRQLAQVLDPAPGVLQGLAEKFPGPMRSRLPALLGQLKVDKGSDQMLLDTVVQVPGNALTCCVGRGDQARPRRYQLLLGTSAVGDASALAFRRARRAWAVAVPVAAAVVSGLVAAAILDGIAGLGNYAAIAGIVALFSLAVAAPTAVLARIRPPLVALAVLVFIVAGIPVSGGPANLASFTPGFLRVFGPVLPLGIAASTIRNVVYFGGHATSPYLWTLAAWALAGVAGLILVTALRRPALVLTGPVAPPPVLAEPVSARPGHASVPAIPDPGAARSLTLVVGFDDSEPARRALVWGADLLRARPGALHVVYADHVLIDSDLSGFGRTEMDEDRDAKAVRVAEAAKEITTAAGTPYTFERRQEPPADAILHAADVDDAAEPASTTVIVTGRSHHAAHRVIGSVPGRLLNESPYPVLTIPLPATAALRRRSAIT